MESKQRKENGVTLIALIITIIVLLILAGVTISAIAGRNGVLTQSTNSVDRTREAQAQEAFELGLAGAQSEYFATRSGGEIAVEGKNQANWITLEKVNNGLETGYKLCSSSGGTIDLTINLEQSKDKVYITKDGLIYKVKYDIDGEGKLENIKVALVDAAEEEPSEFDASDFPASEYGAIVDNYTPVVDTDVQWQVFYTGKGDIENGGTQFTDDDRIYLIATNYVERTNLPSTNNGNKPNDGNLSYKRSAYFTNILNDYTGSKSISNDRLKKLNQKYYDYLKTDTSTYNNIKSVAYMMDTSIWEDADHNVAFMDNNWGEYAIGGPTEELLFASYNKKYGTKWVTKVDNKNGYSFGRYTVDESGNETTSYNYYIPNSSDYLKSNDSTYVINNTSDAYGMWLASPSSGSDNDMAIVGYGGRVYCDWCSSGGSFGFRPLICLKSGVKLEKVSDGHYILK